MSKQKNKGDFEANSMAELQERGVLVVEIRASAAQVVLPLEPSLERDKAVDEVKFHDTYIIHISKFMIIRDYTLLISIPLSLQRPFGRHLLFDIFLLYLRKTWTRHF